MSDQAMFSMSSDFSALTSAMETGEHPCELPAGNDVTSCSQTDLIPAFSGSGIGSGPASPIQDGKDNGLTEIKEDTGKKSPGLSYIALISMAIQSCPEKRMLLSEIYQWISDKYPYYNMKEKSWRNSIRHNLSLNECFVKNGRSENGKGNYWSIHPANIEDFSNGDFRRRRARRRVRKCDEDLKRLCTRSPYTSSPPPSSDNSAASNDGYIPMASTKVPTNFLSSLGMDNKHQDEWNFHNFPYQTNFYPREVCSQYFPYQHSDSYSGLYTPESSKHHLTRPTTTSGELNVNVNVNVCGNTGSSRQHVSPQSPSCYVPSCAQSFRQPFQSSSYDDQANSTSHSGHVITSCMYNQQGQGQAMGYDDSSHDKE